MCRNCGLKESFDGFDECLECAIAYEIAGGSETIDVWRRLHAGTEWLRTVEAEYARQKTALGVQNGL